jgi:protein TonB
VDVRVEVLRQVAPVYPASAERAGAEDVVIVKVLVGPDGQAADVQILRGSKKDPDFDGAAMAAVRQWVFAPARKGGQPVASWYNVGVPFQLKR